MIDPAMSAATGAFAGAAVNQATGTVFDPIPIWVKAGALIALIGFIVWWYLIAQEKHRAKLRRATRRR